jgi:hypothetical protein
LQHESFTLHKENLSRYCKTKYKQPQWFSNGFLCTSNESMCEKNKESRYV